MVVIVVIRVVAAVLLSIWQKVLAQRGGQPYGIVFGMYLLATLLGAPGLACLEIAAFRPEFWGAVGWAGVLDALGNVFLLLSLRVTDLSIFGPLNAYKSVFALLVSYLLLGEVPTLTGILGVLIITGSSLMLLRPRQQTVRLSSVRSLLSPGVSFRLLGILFFVLGSTYLKVSAVAGPLWFAFYGWCVVGTLVSGIAWLVMCRDARLRPVAALRASILGAWKTLLGVSLLHVVMQLATLQVLRETLVGYAMALFQLGVVLHVVAGRTLFQEPDFIRRMLGAVGMVGGSLLILRFG